MSSRAQKVTKYIKETFKTGSCEMFNNNIRFKIIKEDNTIGHIFKELSKNKNILGIEDWEISQPSLYDVFLKVTEN